MLYNASIVFMFILRCRFLKRKSLSECIRSFYGNIILKVVRKYEKLDYQIRKLERDLSFLNKCLENELCPNVN